MLLVDDILVGALVFYYDQPIALGVQSQHGNMNLPVEGNVVFQVSDRGLLGLDARSIVQSLNIVIQIEASLLVERLNLRIVDRILELFLVVDAIVPRRIPAGATLEFSPKTETKRKVDIRQPKILVRFLSDVIGRGWFGRQRIVPAWSVVKRRGKSDSRLP
jgi:hypothetical protein